MSERGFGQPMTTLNVVGSQALTRPDGQVAIMLDTEEMGPVAFVVDRVALIALRMDIADAEALLRRSGQYDK
jgi:hypothetical protein